MKKLRFTVKLDGVPSGKIAGFGTPFDVEKTFGTRTRVPVGHNQWVSLPLVINAHGRMPPDGGKSRDA